MIEVVDNGVGLPQTRMEAESEHGIGLRNVNERLRVIYGAPYQLQLHSLPGQGTSARIEIPEMVVPTIAPPPDAMPIRALVVDDEQLAREELCFLLGQVGGVEIVGQATDGVEALRLAGELKPDVVFLDVQMPGLTGFEVARRLIDADVAAAARVRHGLRPVRGRRVQRERGGLRLKPVDADRLEQTLERRPAPARRREQAAPRCRSRPPTSSASSKPCRRGRAGATSSPIRVGERFILVQAEEVVHASLVDETIVVATSTMSGTSNYRTLDELQTRLDPAVFWRVHRSHLVNITKIKEIVPWFSRNYLLDEGREDDRNPGQPVPDAAAAGVSAAVRTPQVVSTKNVSRGRNNSQAGRV